MIQDQCSAKSDRWQSEDSEIFRLLSIWEEEEALKGSNSRSGLQMPRPQFISAVKTISQMPHSCSQGNSFCVSSLKCFQTATRRSLHVGTRGTARSDTRGLRPRRTSRRGRCQRRSARSFFLPVLFPRRLSGCTKSGSEGPGFASKGSGWKFKVSRSHVCPQRSPPHSPDRWWLQRLASCVSGGRAGD